MSNGIAVFSETGLLTYTTTDVTWNQVAFEYVPAGTNFAKNYPVAAGHELLVVQSMINSPPTDQRAFVNTINIAGTMVTASGASVDTYLLVLMR